MLFSGGYMTIKPLQMILNHQELSIFEKLKQITHRKTKLPDKDQLRIIQGIEKSNLQSD